MDGTKLVSERAHQALKRVLLVAPSSSAYVIIHTLLFCISSFLSSSSSPSSLASPSSPSLPLLPLLSLSPLLHLSPLLLLFPHLTLLQNL